MILSRPVERLNQAHLSHANAAAPTRLPAEMSDMSTQHLLAGRTALVTGAARGIGHGIARAFAAAGAKVVVADVLEEGAQSARDIGAEFVRADLGSDADIDALIGAMGARGAPLDILVNNAGIDVRMPLPKLDVEALDRIWRVNARAPARLIAGLFELLRASPHACVINVTSIHDSIPYAHNSPYCMSKAALAMLTKVASIELAPHGIRVNSLAPGAIETSANRHTIELIGRDQFDGWIPAGRVGQVDDVAGPAVFLASDAARYVTGATLHADGAYRHHLVRYRT
jgi:glucose 1-dehydrogenase